MAPLKTYRRQVVVDLDVKAVSFKAADSVAAIVLTESIRATRQSVPRHLHGGVEVVGLYRVRNDEPVPSIGEAS